jgi:hypothetical protein
MRRASIITVIVLAMIMATASIAIAKSSNHGVEKQKIVQEFDSETGDPVDSPRSFGQVQLTRSDDGVDASVKVYGLEPGGVYTFWWVIPSLTHPVDSFAALGGSKIVGQNGKATVRMTANINDPSVDGFFDHLSPLEPDIIELPDGASFVPLTSDLLDDKIRIEVAYHGNVDSGEYNPQWELDFWTGEAGVCPDASDLAERPTPILASTGQPHCPTFYAAESQATTP